MRAIVVSAGEARLTEQPRPIPEPGEVLIRVHLAGICATDLEIIKGYADYEGILGHEFIGTIIEGPTGRKGRRVVGEINCVCGRCDLCAGGLSNHCRRRTVLGIHGRPGVFAEFVTLPEQNCHDVPETVPDEEAVFAEPLAAAIQIVRQVKIDPRMEVAVLGTGRLGLLVNQVLARTGCRLTAIGRNPRTIGLLDRKRIRALSVNELPGPSHYDLVVDCTGSPEGMPIALRLVRPRGTLVLKTTCHGDAPVDLTPLVVNEITLLGSRCGPIGEALATLERKEIDVASLITRRVPLSRGVEALEQAARPDQIKVLLKNDE